MSQPALRDVRKIAVLRPNAVGDFMFCLPALHALKHTYPEAEVVCYCRSARGNSVTSSSRMRGAISMMVRRSY